MDYHDVYRGTSQSPCMYVLGASIILSATGVSHPSLTRRPCGKRAKEIVDTCRGLPYAFGRFIIHLCLVPLCSVNCRIAFNHDGPRDHLAMGNWLCWALEHREIGREGKGRQVGHGNLGVLLCGRWGAFGVVWWGQPLPLGGGMPRGHWMGFLFFSFYLITSVVNLFANYSSFAHTHRSMLFETFKHPWRRVQGEAANNQI